MVTKVELENNQGKTNVKVYKRRWFILLSYISFAAIGQFQWIEYSIITNIVMRYYNVSASTVDWTAMVFMIAVPILVIPSSYIIDKLGLRVAGLLACLLTAAGVIVKLFSIRQDLFYIVILGQIIVGAAQLPVLSLPSKLAVTWFPDNEVSTACALGVFGMQLGCAVGFILPPTIVKNHEDVADIGKNLYTLCWCLAIAIIPLAIIMIIYFPKQPPLPPNNAQARKKEEFSVAGFFNSIKILMKDKGFLIHLTNFSISIGVYTVFGTLLNQFVLQYFENAQEDAGRMGLVMILGGIVVTPLVGIFLDKTHQYKQTCFYVFVIQTVCIIFLMISFELRQKVLLYIGITILGMSLNAYVTAGIEYSSELTYPAQESTTVGILYAMSQVLGFIFTLVLSNITATFGTLWALVTLMCSLILGTGLTVLTPNRLLRQESFKNGQQPVNTNT